MKTIKEWLEELPEPYRSEAIENMESEVDRYTGDRIENCLRGALFGAFIWVDSPQGTVYWAEIFDSL